ncbi:MAG TPA: TatD family hydrolase [bacterium]|nr:TatD family hydrolase [bacterium]
MWIDTHLHLDAAEFDSDRDNVVARAAAVGVGLMISAATTIAGAERVLELARRYASVRAAAGIYPEHAAAADAAALDALERLARDEAVVAIGEIGLDYVRSAATKPAQAEAFRAQVRLARRLDLPVIVHDRGAHDDVERILVEEGASKVVLHCFSGTPEMAVRCAGRGWMISLAGPVTFRSAGSLRDVARLLPEDRLLLETDAPYLSPAPMRGRRCEPAFVQYTARAVADLRGITPAALEAALERNVGRTFGVSPSGERSPSRSAERWAEKER